VIVLVAAALVASCVALVVSRSVIVVILAQVVLTLLVVALSIPLMRRMHDAIPSTIRTGVASGVSTLTWLVFLPFALAIGFVSDAAGVHTAGWLLVALAAAAAVLVVIVLPGAPAEPVAALHPGPVPAPEPVEPSFPADRFLPPDDPVWPGHWAYPPAAWDSLGLRRHDEDALAQVRAAILELPAVHHRVIVMRDVEGRPPDEVCAALGLSLIDVQTLLNQARGMVRARLERHFERTST
jgi:hypothetical protein